MKGGRPKGGNLPPGVTIDEAELERRCNADKSVQFGNVALEKTEAILKALWDKFDASVIRKRERFLLSAAMLNAESNRRAARDRRNIRIRVLRDIMVREAFVKYHQSQKHFTKPPRTTFWRPATAPPATDNPHPTPTGQLNETHQG